MTIRIDYFASIVAPIATPLAPATILMSGLYSGMVASGVDANLAFVPAIASGAGMELSGMLAGAMTFRAIKERDLTGGILAVIGVMLYVTFAVFGMSKIPKSDVFQAFVLMSLVAYFTAAIYQYFEDKKRDTVDLRQVRAEEQEREISLIKAEKNLVNAERRKALTTGIVHVNNTVNKPGQFPKLSNEKIAEIRQYWQAHPSAKLREAGAACGVSPITAGKYKVQP